MVDSAVRREAALEQWLLLFFAFSAAGWVWEVLLTACTTGRWVNRGMLHGPWLPVYGLGGALMTAALGQLRRKWAAPALGALLGGAVEYATALLLERRFRQRWWDYSGQWGSLDGRICLVSLLGFALAGWALARFGPYLHRASRSLAAGPRRALCRGISFIFALDWSFSLLWPNGGIGVSSPL